MLFTNRNSRHSLLIEINPYQVLAAGVDRSEAGSTFIDCAAEFEPGDHAGLNRWIADHFEKSNTWLQTTASFVPPEALIQRESLVPRKLAESGYLAGFVHDLYKIESPNAWKLQTLSPSEGTVLPADGAQRPALVCGVSHTDVHLMQQRLLDQRLLPTRLELGLLPLIGTISEYQKRQNEKRAVVVVVIEQEHTVAYIIGKEGVSTPSPVRHGFSSIVQVARREFNLSDGAEVRRRLNQPDDELLLRASKLVRSIGRDLKPLVDSYEMTTGQPVGEIYCAYLPASLSWITEPLAQVVGRTPFTLNLPAWQHTAGITIAGDVPLLGQHWLGALSTVAQLPGTETDKANRTDSQYQGPWRFDTRITAALPSSDLIRRRFVANAVGFALAATAVVFTCWLLFLGESAKSESEEWTKRMTENRRDLETLNTTTRQLTALSEQIDGAYKLVSRPYAVTDFVTTIGRTRPANMQIDAIDSLETGAVLRGVLHESSDKARLTLNSYREQLLKDPLVGGAFVSVSLTSFSRRDPKGGEAYEFEFNFKLKPPQP